MNKKWLTLLIAVFLSSTMLMGCNNGDDAPPGVDNNDTINEDDENDKDPDSEDPVEDPEDEDPDNKDE
ncbi:hypothetical protein CVD25_21715 [Bacillus canaveralius]|uniref:DNA primase n=1 Tax=Bacillus canaveralius TaxID=1403243 RepID=A0A2N5GIH3_9BACI|nr:MULTISPECIES: hypothetical protein [Bacillus]PLR80692.1 hypothetical protein CU635_17565 [Bacillus canaveralius]PLR83856.1 hypothetical protein CVD23_13335 [Bacillus sp. V33-4]PLR89109.1 hypothetical protein CVD25_21715 [Bacillus canaveralius]RSK48171.1 hypothetical protein EJA13_16905 [Bacillus canaveralius]